MQIAVTKEIVSKLSNEVDTLEQRNIKAIEKVTKERTADIENSREIYLATNRKSLEPPSGETPKQAGDGSGLPSLVNIAQCTNEQVRRTLVNCCIAVAYRVHYVLYRVLEDKQVN